MTLGTLTFAWFLVAAVFYLAALATRPRPLGRRALWVTLAEALAVTLLGGLFFGTWGHGSWLTLFLLLGGLIAGAQRGLRFAFLRPPEPFDWRGFLFDLVRYLAAGAVLAWRLG